MRIFARQLNWRNQDRGVGGEILGGEDQSADPMKKTRMTISSTVSGLQLVKKNMEEETQ